ncbi:MAG: hypothetical protein FJZ96_00355 [Chloroflexi bacterium]|nr:hypothetical protein [Chloroflexota bacterium]
MRTVRRLYFYAVAFVSLEVVLWGLISLLRSIISSEAVGGGVTQLAQGLALILVGVPVFALHWWVCQRDAAREMDEHASGVRAVFLYAILLSTFIPVIQNVLAIVNRLALTSAHLSRASAFVGGQQSWSDNLVALVMNALIGTYFVFVLRRDWTGITALETFTEVRRIHRYLWALYGLLLTIAGTMQLLQFIFQVPFSSIVFLLRANFVNGLALTIVGTPVWFFAWKTVQDSLSEVTERESLLRLGLLYALALAGVVTVLTSGGIVLDALLRLALGEPMAADEFMGQVSGSLAIGIPLAGVWAYYGAWLTRAMTQVPDAPRRAGMRRLYSYILSAVGLTATFIGLSMLFSFVVDALLGKVVWADLLRPRLAAALATLLAGFPLWILSWRPMQAESLTSGDAGDHARRSLVRKVYLYLALFASVIGGMVSAGILLYTLINALLAGDFSNFTQDFLKSLEILALFTLLGFYHGLTLRQDGRSASQSLARKHAAFSTLVFDPGDGNFGAAVLAAIQKQTPGLPAALQLVGQPIPPEARENVKAVLLPSDLALDPPEALRLWLRDFNGLRLVVPRAAGNWVLVGGAPANVQQAALALRQLAEGQASRPRGVSSGWLVVLYILGGLFGLQALMVVFSLLMTALFD